MCFSNLQNKYSKSLSCKFFTVMGEKFKFQVQDSYSEFLFWRFDKLIALSEKTLPLAFKSANVRWRIFTRSWHKCVIHFFIEQQGRQHISWSRLLTYPTTIRSEFLKRSYIQFPFVVFKIPTREVEISNYHQYLLFWLLQSEFQSESHK